MTDKIIEFKPSKNFGKNVAEWQKAREGRGTSSIDRIAQHIVKTLNDPKTHETVRT